MNLRIFLLTLILFLITGFPGLLAQDEHQENPEPTLTNEEIESLLNRVDDFFISQDLAQVNVDIDIYRDPSNRLNDKNIKSDNPSKIAGLSTIVSHFEFQDPGTYSLEIMGEKLAGSDVPDDQTFYSMLLPLPGAPIYTETIREKFRVRHEGYEDVEGRKTYKLRFTANDKSTEFFDYVVYYIDCEREIVRRMTSAFDNGYYTGTAEGNFYYDNYKGKFLPLYAHGSVLFFPNKRFNLWGKWYKWKWLTVEELNALNKPVN